MEKHALQTRNFQIEKLKVEVHSTAEAAGAAAARATADTMIELGRNNASFGVIFATGASQLDTLLKLTAIADVPWNKVVGFHMDEYVGLPIEHRASFRRYLRERLTGKVKMKSFLEVDGNAADAELFCRTYGLAVRAASPALCLLGIGENGHLAFNDPWVADFNDPLDVKVVTLDTMCRQQQAAEGWFDSLEEVPQKAISLTIPTLFRVPKLIASVPGHRKATIVRRALEEPISTECPATLLRTHPDATLYLDYESAAELDGLL
jgi:glucosamine-6-phosphate deaminase